MDDYQRGLEKAKNIYRDLHPGQCKVPSKGGDCTCFLCQCDEVIARHLSSKSSIDCGCNGFYQLFGVHRPGCPHAFDE